MQPNDHMENARGLLQQAITLLEGHTDTLPPRERERIMQELAKIQEELVRLRAELRLRQKALD